MMKKTERYLHLWGGSGSGKSVFAAQKVLDRVVEEKGHRILCVRKVAKSLRSSVYQLIRDQIADLGWSKDFTVHKSEMRFTHTNGSELLLAGLDDVEQLKSITGITSIWIEEATELTAAEFDQLDLRLRGKTPGYKQIIFSYNPIDERHWIKARFHDNPPADKAGEPAIDTCLLRTTFRDNTRIDAEYRRVMELKALVNPNLYRVYFLAEWGKEEVQRPYVYNFNKERTVSAEAIFRPELPLSFSLDFNVEPFVCVCAHIWTNSKGLHYHIFKELVIEKNGDVHQMLALLKATFPLQTLASAVFTGDAMQRKREITQPENRSAWAMIDNQLRLGSRLKLPKRNPSVKDNRHLVNVICAFHPDFKIHPECLKLIYDLQYVETDEEGNILKQNRNNEAQRADALDAFRYQCNTHLSDFYKHLPRIIQAP